MMPEPPMPTPAQAAPRRADDVPPVDRAAVRYGLRFGIGCGASGVFAGVLLNVQELRDGPGVLLLLPTCALFLILLYLFGEAGFWAARRTGSVGAAVLAGALAGLLSGIGEALGNVAASVAIGRVSAFRSPLFVLLVVLLGAFVNGCLFAGLGAGLGAFGGGIGKGRYHVGRDASVPSNVLP